MVLIGPSGCGKSTFARKHFKPTEVMSSDGFRALVSDDENDQSSTDDAFAALHFVAARRLARGKLTVVDATNVQPEARKPLVALAREYHVLPVAIVIDLPERVCHERNRSRPDRDFGPHVIRNQRSQLHRSLRGLGREGFRHVHVLKSQEEVDAQSSSGSRFGTTASARPARSTSSATCMALRRARATTAAARVRENDGAHGNIREAVRRSSSGPGGPGRASSTLSGP